MMGVLRREIALPHAIATRFEERTRMHMATRTKHWTLEDVHSLPDDGTKYELVRGELFVTPPPTYDHEDILARLNRVLVPYVDANGLGLVHLARSVVRFEGSEVEPDLFVSPEGGTSWDDAPTPILVVEVLSPSTRRRDQTQKRELYLDAGVAEYWIVDGERREVRVIRREQPDSVASGELVWHPAGGAEALRIRLDEVFGV